MRTSVQSLPSSSQRSALRRPTAPAQQCPCSQPRLGASHRTLATICRATDGNDFESLFAKELKRRGMEGQDEPAAEPKDPFKSAGTSTKTKTRAPPPSSSMNDAEPSELDGQRKRTLGFVNEGLEGLIPRGSELLKLGGSVFLGFLPFMLAFSLLFTGIFAVFGESFLHGGRPNSGPVYVDPQTLLSNPTVDPYVPY